MIASVIKQKSNVPGTLTYSGMETFEPQTDTDQSGAINSYADLIARLPGKKYSTTIPIIPFTNAYTNVSPCGKPIPDPADATKFLMYVGRFPGNSRTNAIISVYRGSYSNPWVVTYVQDVLTKGASGFDNNGTAFGDVLVESGTIYIIYGAQNTAFIESVGLVSSTDGLNFTGRTQLIAPDGINETGMTDPSIIKEGSTYYLFITKKTGVVNVNIIPVGVLIASSSSISSGWTKTGTQCVAIGSGTDPDGKYIEGGQILKFGSDFVFLYTECSNTDIWSIRVARSTIIVNTYTKGPIVIEHSSSGVDSEGVAVPVFWNYSGNNYMILIQGTAQPQPASIWSIIAVDLSTKVTYCAGFIDGKNGWSGDVSQFDITGAYVLNGVRSLRALKNTTTVSVSKTQNVTPSATAFYRATMLSPDNTTDLLAGFYVMEGATVITGVYFDAGNIKDLRSGATWTTLQTYATNTKYVIEIDLINSTTHTIKINGSTIATGVSNNNTISIKADKIKLEKQTTSTSVVYFDDILCANQ